MRPIRIVTEGCCDLSQETREKLGIDCAKMSFACEGREYDVTLNWEEYSPKEFYDMMREGKRITTTQVPMEEFERIFRARLEEGYDIVYVACSSKLSGSVNAGEVVARKLLAEFPEAKIVCVDSKNACLGEGMMVMDAAGLRDAGKTVEEIVEYLEKNKLKYNQFATAETLEYLRRAGRVKATAAFFGNLFGIKPIIVSDAVGRNLAVKKVKGRVGSLRELVAMAKEALDGDGEGKTIGIAHADCLAEAEALRDMLTEATGCTSYYISVIGPIVGASVGPGTIGVYVYGKEVTVGADE